MTESIRIAVCGAHMSGLPLNHQLTNIGGELVMQTTTAPYYQLYKLAGFTPARPGLLREQQGTAIAVEVWEIPIRDYGTFVTGIPSPLSIGTIEGLSANPMLSVTLKTFLSLVAGAITYLVFRQVETVDVLLKHDTFLFFYKHLALQ